MRKVLPLSARQAEIHLCGVQSGTQGSSEFETNQARAGEFARDQARARDKIRARNQARARSQAEPEFTTCGYFGFED